MSSLFDGCAKWRKPSENCCEKCKKYAKEYAKEYAEKYCDKCNNYEGAMMSVLEKQEPGEKSYILVDSYPEFMPVEFVSLNEQTSVATFNLNESISPQTIAPLAVMAQSQTMMVPANNVKCIIPMNS